MLEQVGLVFNMLCSADVNDQLLAAKEQAMPLLAAHRDNILLDEVLFDKIKSRLRPSRQLGSRCRADAPGGEDLR